MDRRVALRHEPLIRRADGRVAAGACALAAIGVLVLGAFAGMAVEAARDPSGAASAFNPYLWRVARFTLVQAALSTVLSVVPAIFVARAFAASPDLPVRRFALSLFALPLALPAIVAALGVLALYGRAGLVAGPLGALTGGTWPGIYGLSGILVAHVFFNLPLATRLILGALETVPADQWRLAAQLGMGGRARFRLIEWPVLKAAVPGVAALVFMLCITSFTIVLTLGGGPRATTLEVAIYQALRFDFVPSRAVALVAVQIALTVAAVLVLSRLGGEPVPDRNLPVATRRPPGTRWSRAADAAIVGIAFVFVAGPLAAVLVSGLAADLGRLAADPAVHRATATSLAFAALSASIAVALSLALAAGRSALAQRRHGRARLLAPLMDTGAGFVLVVPPIVVGAGWFILLRGTTDVLALAPVMVVTVNAVMAMPFALRAIRPAWDLSAARHDRLAASLGMAGAARWRLVEWPALRRPLLVAFAFAMALSLGDLGVIALFGSDAVQTLPYLLLQRMGSYRTADAAGIALMLGALCLLLMWIADRGGERAG